MKKMLIAGNWKMHKNLGEAISLAIDIAYWVQRNNVRSNVAICPPFPFLREIARLIEYSPVKIGAQNCHFEPEGAYTGEVSPRMLASIGCEYVIIGHSERRTYFLESDELINKKIISALEFGLKPIFCIGETLQERQDGKTFEVLERQIRIGLQNVPSDLLRRIVVAFEPVWAIGTGISAKREQIDEAHRFIREFLTNNFGENASEMLILYGGSLNPQNAQEILSIPNVNGGLIGKASLEASDFTKIIEFAEKSMGSDERH